jgi:hypothetical protein
VLEPLVVLLLPLSLLQPTSAPAHIQQTSDKARIFFMFFIVFTAPLEKNNVRIDTAVSFTSRTCGNIPKT